MGQNEEYLADLLSLNEFLSSKDKGFRTQDVYCVDINNRKINFAAPSDIAQNMAQLMSVFAAEYERASTVPLLSKAFAKFYYGFISVHPFMDANRRTAFAFIEKRAANKGYDIGSLDVLRNIILEGHVAAEMKKLIVIFEYLLKQKKGGLKNVQK